MLKIKWMQRIIKQEVLKNIRKKRTSVEELKIRRAQITLKITEDC